MKLILSPAGQRRRRQSGGAVGRLLLILAIAAVLTFALGPLGAGLSVGLAFSIGIAVGSIIAAVALPQKPPQFDPLVPAKPGEFTVPPSSEGVGIPYLAGYHKLGLIYFWATGFRSEQLTQTVASSGGKGGGKKTETTQVVGYEYFSTFAMGAVLGRSDAIHAIYSNEELIWGRGVNQATVTSGNLVVGKTYRNNGPNAIIHGGVTIIAGKTFVASETTFSVANTPGTGVCPLMMILPAYLDAFTDYWVPKGVISYNGNLYGDGQASRVISGLGLGFAPVVVSGGGPDGGSLLNMGVIKSRSEIGGFAADDIGRKFRVHLESGSSVTYQSISRVDGEILTGTGSSLPLTIVGNAVVVEDTRRVLSGQKLYVDGFDKIILNGRTWNNRQTTDGSIGNRTSTKYTFPETSATTVSLSSDSVIRASEKYTDFTVGKSLVRIYWGDYNQLPPNQPGDSFLSAAQMPVPNVAYPGICYLIFRDFSLGNYTSVPRLTIELERSSGVYYSLSLHASDFPANPPYTFPDSDFVPDLVKDSQDVNPAVALYEILIHQDLGSFYPPDQIDWESFRDAAAQLESEGIRLSIYLSQSTSVERALTDLLIYIEGVLFFDGLKLKLKLIRDDYSSPVSSGSLQVGRYYTPLGGSVSYNGETYLANTSFLCVTGVLTFTTVSGTPTVLQILAIDYNEIYGTVKLSRQSVSQLSPEIAFAWTNRSRQFKTTYTPKRIAAHFDESSNPIPDAVDLPWVTTAEVAGKIIGRILRKRCMTLASLSAEFTRIGSALEPGSVFLLTNLDAPEIPGTSTLFFRVASINDNSQSNSIVVEAVEDIYTGFSNDLTTPVDPPVADPPGTLYPLPYFTAIELPWDLRDDLGLTNSVALALLGMRSSSAQLTFAGHASVGSGSFKKYGSSTGFILKGLLLDGYSITPNYDSTFSLEIDFAGNFSSEFSPLAALTSYTLSDGLASSYFLLMGDEILQVVKAKQVGDAIYSFSVLRGRYNTLNTIHPREIDVVLLSFTSGVLIQDSSILVKGSSVAYKAQAIGVSSSDDLTVIPSKNLTTQGKFFTPFEPTGFKGNGSQLAPHFTTGQGVSFSWVPRQRGAGYLYSADADTDLNGLSLAGGKPVFAPGAPLVVFSDSSFEIDILHPTTYAVTRTIKTAVSGGGSSIQSFTAGVYTSADIVTDGFGSSGFIARLYSVGTKSGEAGNRSLNFSQLRCWFL